jgi:CheY-like chemotaxis protein
MKMLIVDDSRSSRLMIKICLKEIQGEFEGADGAEAAVEKYKTGQFDLVIMDIHMPRIDGYEAIRRIRAYETQTKRDAKPIIALTAMDIVQAAPKTKAVGATTCLSKPVKQVALVEAIRSVTSSVGAAEIPGPAPIESQDAPGRFKKFLGFGKERELDGMEHDALRGERPDFLAEKLREIYIATVALESGNLEMVRVLAHRLKGEGANFGFKEVSGFGAALATAIEDRDMKTARVIVQKLQAFVSKASA